jgi:hypothetical protein
MKLEYLFYCMLMFDFRNTKVPKGLYPSLYTNKIVQYIQKSIQKMGGDRMIVSMFLLLPGVAEFQLESRKSVVETAHSLLSNTFRISAA